MILAKLATRELAPEILDICNDLAIHIFPGCWGEIDGKCNCPDYACPCKHIAAVIYTICQQIDANPFFLFELHGIDIIKELKKRNVQLQAATQTALPTLQEFLHISNIATAPQENITTEADDNSTQTDLVTNNADDPLSNDDLQALAQQIDFCTINTKIDDIVELFAPSPAGYSEGTLRKTLNTIYTKASKLATSNMKDKLSRSVATSDEQPLITLNSKGVYSFNPTWQSIEGEQYTHGNFISIEPPQKQVASETYKIDDYQAICNLYSYGISSKEFANEDLATEAVYHVWVLATKLVQAGAIIPQMYEYAKNSYRIRWIGAYINEDIATILRSLGLYLKNIPHLERVITLPPVDKTPVSYKQLDDLELAHLLLSPFITSYVMLAACEQLDTYALNIEQLLLLFAKEVTVKPKSKQLADQQLFTRILALENWLADIQIGNNDYKPVLVIQDILQKVNDNLIDVQTSLVMSITMNRYSREHGTKHIIAESIALADILQDEQYDAIRLDCMQALARLSHTLPQVNKILRNKTHTCYLALADLSVLMFQAIPTLKMLGVQLIIPKALQKFGGIHNSLKLDLETEAVSCKRGSFVTLTNLIRFSWELAVGSHEISTDEFEALKEYAGSFVRFKNEFVYIDPKVITTIDQKLQGNSCTLSPYEKFAAIITGEYNDRPIIMTDEARNSINQFLEVQEIAPPDTIRATLRPYQVRGFSWLYKNTQCKLGSIIADDMGLGKTLQVITTLEKLRLNGELDDKPAIIVVPTTLLINWTKELDKFAPCLTYTVFYGKNNTLPQEHKHLILTTYGTIKNYIDLFKKIKYRLVIIDEAQAIKNPNTSAALTIKSLKADSSIAMSGTPVENNLTEYWSIMDFANHGLLGTSANFRKTYALPIERQHNNDVLNRFLKVTSPFILRRLKSDKKIISDLPDKVVHDDYCELTPIQATLYQSVVEEIMQQLEKKSEEGESIQNRHTLVLKMILELKQICNTPLQYVNDAQYDTPEASGKVQRLFELIDELLEADKKALIFTQFKEMGLLLQKWLNERYQMKINFIHGGVPAEQRMQIVEKFQEDRREKLLLLSLKAAGTGLNLTSAQAVIHFDLWWNPAVEAQATDRAYRIGQKKNVNVYRFICAHTFEEKINAMINAKKALSELTVAEGESWIGNLSNHDIKEIFTLTEDEE